MTARQVYEAVLIELNKVNAPTILLEDFNYLFNKAINQYINKKYNIYDVNQQSTDDLRVLKSSAILKPSRDKAAITYKNAFAADGAYEGSVFDTKLEDGGDDVTLLDSLYGATFEFDMPDDYLHMLNCTCIYFVKQQFKCYDAGTYVQMPAKRLTSDGWSTVVSTIGWQRPSYRSPYYYIHHVNTSSELPTNEVVIENGYLVRGTDSGEVSYTPPVQEEDPDVGGGGSGTGGGDKPPVTPSSKVYIYQASSLPSTLSAAESQYNSASGTKATGFGTINFSGRNSYLIVITTNSGVTLTDSQGGSKTLTRHSGFSDTTYKCFYYSGGVNGQQTIK